MRKPAFCICENKGADQLHSNRAADQPFCFHYIDSTNALLPKPLAIFCGFVLYLVGNPEDGFSRDVAHFYCRTVSRISLPGILFTFMTY